MSHDYSSLESESFASRRSSTTLDELHRRLSEILSTPTSLCLTVNPVLDYQSSTMPRHGLRNGPHTRSTCEGDPIPHAGGFTEPITPPRSSPVEHPRSHRLGTAEGEQPSEVRHRPAPNPMGTPGHRNFPGYYIGAHHAVDVSNGSPPRHGLGDHGHESGHGDEGPNRDEGFEDYDSSEAPQFPNSVRGDAAQLPGRSYHQLN